MICRRLFLVGASGVGKSLIAETVVPILGLKYIPISAQEGYKHYKTTPAEAFRDAPLMAKVQQYIGPYTAERLEIAGAEPAGYITDRSFDLSIYGAILGYPHPKAVVARVLAAMNQSPAGVNQIAVTVVFVRPHIDVIRIARAKDGGRRSQFLTDEWVYRLDGALCHFLRANFIPHLELPEDCRRIEDRAKWVADAVRDTPESLPSRWVDPDGGIW